MSKDKIYYSCYDFNGLQHCMSCHEDNQEYDYDLCTFEKDNIVVHCCCNAMNQLEAMTELELKERISKISHEKES
jgi:hypothetical protein